MTDDRNGTSPHTVYAPDGWKFAYMNGQTVEKYMGRVAYLSA
ncbi:MAG: hypothetical protein WCC92_21345 [Candidatus Korobacteraceae bacterium]